MILKTGQKTAEFYKKWDKMTSKRVKFSSKRKK